jgi:hypothetical protein
MLIALTFQIQGHYSEPVPAYEASGSKIAGNKSGVKKRESKRNHQARTTTTAAPVLVEDVHAILPRLSLDRVTGKVTDENSGKTYYLQPTN